MLRCEELFGMNRGLEIQELIEDATGELCPCKRSQPCVLEVPERPALVLVPKSA